MQTSEWHTHTRCSGRCLRICKEHISHFLCVVIIESGTYIHVCVCTTGRHVVDVCYCADAIANLHHRRSISYPVFRMSAHIEVYFRTFGSLTRGAGICWSLVCGRARAKPRVVRASSPCHSRSGPRERIWDTFVNTRSIRMYTRHDIHGTSIRGGVFRIWDLPYLLDLKKINLIYVCIKAILCLL